MSAKNSPVLEEGSRFIEGRCRLSFGWFEVGGIGIEVSVLLLGVLTGLGARLLSSATPIQQNSPGFLVCFDFGLGAGLSIRSGRCSIRRETFPGDFAGTGFRLCLCSFFLPSTSSKPSLSINVSTLVRSRIVAYWMPCWVASPFGVAWSLCCQQNDSGLGALRGLGVGLGEAFGDLEMPRLHGRPAEVRPLHVARGFLESDR